MTDVRQQHGAVCWAELVTKNPKASADFYAKLFGWTSQDVEMKDGSGTYTCFSTRDGIEIAGAMAPQCDQQPTVWGLHFHVDDVDEAVTTAVANGGTILMEAFNCPDVGRMAYLTDSQGAAFAVIKLDKPIGSCEG